MAIGYKVLRDFIGTVNGKDTLLKANEILSAEVVDAWKNKENCINCRYILEIEIQEEKKEQKEIKKSSEVF